MSAAGVPKRVKVGYGVADFGVSGATLVLQLYLFEYYTVVVGVSAGLVGAAMALALVWDAVSDPLMGVLCDRTRTRWGRFLPWMVIGGLALPAAFWLLFHPPLGWSPAATFAWLLGSFLAVNTGLTLIGVPHLALGGALTARSEERTEVFGWRLVFGTLGLLFGVGAPLLAAHLGNLDTAGVEGLDASRRGAADWMAGAIVLSILFTVVLLGRFGRAEPTSPPLRWSLLPGQLREVLRNPFFLPLLLSFMVVSIGRAANSVLALPYYKYSLRLEESDVQQWILGVFALCIMASIAVWVPLSRRYGKKWTGFTGMAVLGLMTCIAYPLFPAGDLTGPLLAAIVGGFAVGAIILFESMVTDVADVDRWRCGEDREGVYFGFWRLGQKLSNAAGVLFIGLLLDLIGFREGAANQDPATARGLAWLFGPGVGVFFLLGAALFARSPLTRARYETLRREFQTREPSS